MNANKNDSCVVDHEFWVFLRYLGVLAVESMA